jgi:hypothetical protein
VFLLFGDGAGVERPRGDPRLGGSSKSGDIR